jgi:thymidylate synthase
MTANDVWYHTALHLLNTGKEFNPKDLETREHVNFQTAVPMSHPFVTYKERKLGYKFMAAEAATILIGGNTVASLKPFSKEIASFSDDGYFFSGAYGPRVVDQLTYIVDCLVEDEFSRQAVMTLWRKNPRPSKDIPCTVALQFLIRDGKLHCIATMRSSDIWLGWPYDVFNFTMISHYLSLLWEHRKGYRLMLGILYINAGSQHLYWDDFDKVKKLHAGDYDDKIVLVTESHNPFISFNSPHNLVEWLIERAENGDLLDKCRQD